MGLFKNLINRKSGSSRFTAEASLFEPDQRHRILEIAGELTANRNIASAIALLRAGAVRFHPFPEAEAALSAIEGSQARSKIEKLEEQAAAATDVRLFAACSIACDNLGDSTAAILHGRAAIQEDPFSPLGYLVIGLSHLRRFRTSQSAAEGLNTLRYLSKSIQLRPGQGESLRSLAELLILLRAPVAARRVLRPIAHALPHDPMLLAIEARAVELPPEGTSNVQELFLRFEENPLEAEEPEEMPDLVTSVDELVHRFEGSMGAWLVGSDLQVCASSTRSGRDAGESDEVLGALAGFLSSHCDRMRIGSFKSLRVLGEGHLILARKLSTGSTIFYSGSQQDGIAQVERCLQNSFDDQVEVGAKR